MTVKFKLGIITSSFFLTLTLFIYEITYQLGLSLDSNFFEYEKFQICIIYIKILMLITQFFFLK